MDDPGCIFCKIVKGEINSHKVFESDRILAFLDAHPLSKGHTLIIPKAHVARLENLEWEDAETLFKTLYKVVEKTKTAVNAHASTVAINNGPESGQEIPHIHVHVIPRFMNDGGGPIHAIMSERPYITDDEMAEIAKKMRSLLQ
jgi:histidine triad (HIT) family protein